MTKRRILTMRDAAAHDVISKIAHRAVSLYASYDIEIKHRDVLMDLACCHFNARPLRLDDLLAADEFDFAHDIAGINRHLDRESGKLTDGFSPRFSVQPPIEGAP